MAAKYRDNRVFFLLNRRPRRSTPFPHTTPSRPAGASELAARHRPVNGSRIAASAAAAEPRLSAAPATRPRQPALSSSRHPPVPSQLAPLFPLPKRGPHFRVSGRLLAVALSRAAL